MKISLPELTREELDDLTDRLTDAEIGARAGLCRTAVTRYRNKFGIKSWAQKHGTRRYRSSYTPKPDAKRAFSHRLGCNEDCFASIDTPEGAYWLGLLAADGWIVTYRDEPIGVALALHPRDMELLHGYADFVGFKGEPKRTRPEAELYQVKISSKRMTSDLIRHGIVPRKSRVIELPAIQDHLMPHFIRGLFDGDGHVAVRNTSITAQLTTASEALAGQVKQLIDPHLPRPCTLGRDRNAYVLRWYADNALELARYLYLDSTLTKPRMERKAEIFFGFQGSGAGHSWVRY